MSGPSNPRRSRIAHFKAPFILSVAGSAALSFGCGGKTDADLNSPNPQALACKGDRPRTTNACGGYSANCINGEWVLSYNACNPPAPLKETCPENPGRTDSHCGDFVPGLTCSYDDGCSGISIPTRRCSETSHRWEAIPPPSCNPPPLDYSDCGTTLPVAGSDCAIPALTCSYPGGCEEPSTATCQSGQWLVVLSSGPACNPPAVVPVCPERELVSGEGCAYEGQACSNEACESAASHDGFICSSGQWQAAVVFCAPDAGAPDAGASDGGVGDGGG